MKFIADTQLPPRLAIYLSSKGIECIHTTEFKNGHLLQDVEIIEIALNQNRIIITKDSDFSDYYYIRGAPPKILLLQFGNISNANLINYFEQYLNFVLDAFKNGADYVQFSRDGITTN